MLKRFAVKLSSTNRNQAKKDKADIKKVASKVILPTNATFYYTLYIAVLFWLYFYHQIIFRYLVSFVNVQFSNYS